MGCGTVTDGVPERLTRARNHLGLTVVAATKLAGLKDRKTWDRYEQGDTRPNSDTLAVLYERGIDINWLLSGEGEMLRATALRVSGAVPVVGMAECGLKGWYQESPTGLFASAPPSVAADAGALAVIATGHSMRPAGIQPGDLVFCQPPPGQPTPGPRDGDAVLVEIRGGALALKRWGGLAGGWITLHGWLDPDEAGVQTPVQDRRRADQVTRVLSVALVQTGLVQQIAPGGAAAGEEYTQNDRLYDIAIKATLRWHETARMDFTPPKLAGMVTRAVRMLRGRHGAQAMAVQAMTDAELASEVEAILDVARDMAAAAGWAAKDS